MVMAVTNLDTVSANGIGRDHMQCSL